MNRLFLVSVMAMVMATTAACTQERKIYSRQYEASESDVSAASAMEENARAAELADEKAEEAATQKTSSKVASEPRRKPASRGGVQAYVVQIGAFRIKENAERLHQKLKADGFPVIMHPMSHSKNGELYLVRMEPTPDLTEAKTLMQNLKAKTDIEPQLIKR